MVCQVTNSQGYFCRLRKWFLFRFTLLVVFDYFCAIYSKCHPLFGIIITMYYYLKRDFVPKYENKRGTFVSPLEPLRRKSSTEQLECLKTRR